MKTEWILEGIGQEACCLTFPAKGRAPAKTVRPVLTGKEVCRRLGKSRRQVYRYLKTGRLRPCARILDQWLFDLEEIVRFQAGGVPSRLRTFFWDVPVGDLSPVHHRDFILARLLEFGDREAIQWLFRTYSKDEIVRFLKERGAYQLSKRSWGFWADLFGVAAASPKRALWHRGGRRWGGVP